MPDQDELDVQEAIRLARTADALVRDVKEDEDGEFGHGTHEMKPEEDKD